MKQRPKLSLPNDLALLPFLDAPVDTVVGVTDHGPHCPLSQATVVSSNHLSEEIVEDRLERNAATLRNELWSNVCLHCKVTQSVIAEDIVI